MTGSIEVRNECPYCGYRFTVEARDVRGEIHALRCLDCKRVFVVEITCTVSHTVTGLAGIDRDLVLDELGRKPGADASKPAPKPRDKAPIVITGRRVREVNGHYGNGPEERGSRKDAD